MEGKTTTERETRVITPDLASRLLHPRDPRSHKGDFGRALLVAGSRGMMGAALLSARACMRSGVGLLTVRVPQCGYTILQLGLPEAKCDCDADESAHSRIVVPSGTDAVGIGPGLGQAPATHTALDTLLDTWRGPLVVDADALNILAVHPDWLARLPQGTVLTPHPGEMQRLGGDAAGLSDRHGLVVVLKGHETCIHTPGGPTYINRQHGNAGMAVGGSGDVLTGIILSLLAQHYSPAQAATLGVWLHALAGDLALQSQSQESLLPSDLTDRLGQAFRLSRGSTEGAE